MVTGQVYNADMTVPYTLPDNKTRSTIKSNSSLNGGGFNELRFEDKKGSEEVFFQAQKDYNVVVLNNETRKITQDSTTTVDKGNRAITVSTGDQSLTVSKGKRTVTVDTTAPTILTHGTEDQKRRYLRPLWTCEHVWCQLFSEPGAGSDVASLAARAVRDGDEWVANGQKVWTTLAHRSRYGMLLARTDPEAEKHKGLTYFVVDMHAPGVEVRPLRQMTGDAEFNEVYFTDVRIPDAERLGDVGQGWHAALTTLMNERVSIGGAIGSRGTGPIGTALRLWQARTDKDPVLRDRVVKLWVESEAHRMTSMRAAANSLNGTPGPEGSTAKLHFAELNKRIYELCVALQGAEGMLYDESEMRQPETAGGFGGTPQRMFLRSRANSIEGGTSEVMRNILGERILGLPGDVRVDKGRPWTEIPR